ncbi:MAG: hypothetical protein ABIP51_01285, partial [Bacteroidia bacterium]
MYLKLHSIVPKRSKTDTKSPVFASKVFISIAVFTIENSVFAKLTRKTYKGVRKHAPSPPQKKNKNQPSHMYLFKKTF